ncbi:MAG TPA: hypothetical protein VK777_11040 [Reyranella sp.]|nr:hypothetical protein [Reyranella sp.]
MPIHKLAGYPRRFAGPKGGPRRPAAVTDHDAVIDRLGQLRRQRRDACVVRGDHAEVSVKGDDRHPLYNALVETKPKAEGVDAMREKLSSYGVPAGAESDVLWNFEKFVVGWSGEVIARFSPDIVPEDPRLLATVGAALAN